MAILHQELDAMILGRNWISVGDLDDGQIADIQFVAAGNAGCTLFSLDCPRDGQAAFLRQLYGLLEQFGRDIALEEDGLTDAGAVAQLNELQPSFAGLVVDPTLQGHFLADMFFQLSNRRYWRHSSMLHRWLDV